MCGIFGYIGNRPILPVLLNGLEKLEYRGYDSAGVAVLGNDLQLFKRQGKIALLREEIGDKELDGRVGIGHTRWATHGAPTDYNAHPHLDCTGSLAMVHNGIIENHLELKSELLDKGHLFRSDTDTEVIPHLIEEELAKDHDLLSAILRAVSRLRGSFALAVIDRDFPEEMIAVRQESPLVLGLGKGENFLASDIPALLPYTKDILILENAEVAVIKIDKVEIFNFQGERLERKPISVDWDSQMTEKAGFEHYMLKEIHEQPSVLRATLEGHLDLAKREVFMPEGPPDEILSKIERVYITACGTAYHAGVYGKNLIEALVRIPAEAEIGSEFRYRPRPFLPNSLGIVISQSGETADTLAALRRMKEAEIPIFAITNVHGSSVSREANWIFYTKAGPEVAVASTKAYTAQLLSLALFTLKLASLKGRKGEKEQKLIEELQRIPALAESVFNLEGQLQDYAHRLRYLNDYFIIGRGLDFVTAMEGSLKLKEISYIHSEAYPAGELKHGPLALITPEKHVCLLATQQSLQSKIASNFKEVKARGAEVLAIMQKDNPDLEPEETLLLPQTEEIFSPILAIIPLQLFAYYMAKERGCDIDQPRNLAKSVTVE